MDGLEALGDLDGWQAALAALTVGLAGSLHCFLMCGPLACASGGRDGLRARTIFAYQLARVGAYTLAGALLGAVGEGAGALLRVDLAPIAPWLLVAALLASALELGRRVAPIPGVAKFVRRAGLAAQGLPPLFRALAIGALTPLLPCGLLYGLFAAAAASGSLRSGAMLMAAFSLGAIPALLFAQLQLRALLSRGGKLELALRRGVPALAALVVAYRALFIHAGHSCH